MPQVSPSAFSPWWVLLLPALWSCGDAAEGDVSEFPGTVLTLELAALDREDAWSYLETASVSYFLARTEDGPRQTWEGTFELAGQGAAELTDGGRTEVLRAVLDLPPGRYDYRFQLRQADGQAIFSVDESIGVAADTPTEIYSLFDLRTADPLPIRRPLDVDLRILASPTPMAIDTIDYEIECGVSSSFLDSEIQGGPGAPSIKRTVLCTVVTSGRFERADTREGDVDFDSRWTAGYDVGCGPCTMDVVVRDADGEGLCTASIEFEVLGWGFSELPAEQVSLSLPCGGGGP